MPQNGLILEAIFCMPMRSNLLQTYSMPRSSAHNRELGEQAVEIHSVLKKDLGTWQTFDPCLGIGKNRTDHQFFFDDPSALAGMDS